MKRATLVLVALALSGCAGLLPARYERAAYDRGESKTVMPQAKVSGACVTAALAALGGRAILNPQKFVDAANRCLWELFGSRMECREERAILPEPEFREFRPGTYTPAITEAQGEAR